MIDKTIRELREDLGWTQANLAKHLGVTDKAIKNWEGGSSKGPHPLLQGEKQSRKFRRHANG